MKEHFWKIGNLNNIKYTSFFLHVHAYLEMYLTDFSTVSLMNFLNFGEGSNI